MIFTFITIININLFYQIYSYYKQISMDVAVLYFHFKENMSIRASSHHIIDI